MYSHVPCPSQPMGPMMASREREKVHEARSPFHEVAVGTFWVSGRLAPWLSRVANCLPPGSCAARMGLSL